MQFNYTTESAKSTIRAVLSRALAEALICGIDQAEAEGRPLSQVQCIDMATMSIMAYDQALEACEGIDLESKLLVAAWT